MSLRRAPRDRWQRTSDAVRAQRVSGAEHLYNASPIPPRSSQVGDSGVVVVDTEAESHFIEDPFTLSGTFPEEFALTYLPADGSWNVSINSLDGLNDQDYEVDGQILRVLDGPLTPLAGDTVQIQYDYLTGMPVAPADYGSNYVTAVMEDSPLVYYRMNGTGTIEEDVTSHNRDGTLTGDYIRSRPGLLSSDSDTCTDFGDGSQRIGAIGTPGSYVTCPYDSGLITPDFTFECWTSKGTSGLTPMMQQDDRIKIALGGVGFFQVSFWDGASWVVVSSSAGGIITGSDYATGRHLAVVFDSTANTVTYYADGSVFEVDTGVTTNLLSASSSLHFGWISGSSGLPDLDEVAWYGTALTSDQIRAHWDAR